MKGLFAFALACAIVTAAIAVPLLSTLGFIIALGVFVAVLVLAPILGGLERANTRLEAWARQGLAKLRRHPRP